MTFVISNSTLYYKSSVLKDHKAERVIDFKRVESTNSYVQNLSGVYSTNFIKNNKAQPIKCNDVKNGDFIKIKGPKGYTTVVFEVFD